MDTTVGDRIVVQSQHVTRPPRTGVIEEVLRPRGRYRVRWSDGRSSTITPNSGGVSIIPGDGETAAIVSSALCRSVNDRIRELERPWRNHNFICECSDGACTQVMRLDVQEYEAVRADPSQFAILPGHAHLPTEHVVLRTDRYWLVRKIAQPSSHSRDEGALQLAG